MRRKMIIIMALLLVASFMFTSPAEARQLAVPGGWAIDITVCRDGITASVIVPANTADALHEVVILSANPALQGTPATYTVQGPTTDAFVGAPGKFLFFSELAVGTEVTIVGDRLEDGVSTTGGSGVELLDTVTDCYIQPALPPNPLDDGNLYRQNGIIIYPQFTVYGDCSGNNCNQIGYINTDDLLPVAGGQSASSGHAGWDVIVYYLGPDHLVSGAHVYQINVYAGGVLIDDHFLISVGSKVTWRTH